MCFARVWTSARTAGAVGALSLGLFCEAAARRAHRPEPTSVSARRGAAASRFSTKTSTASAPSSKPGFGETRESVQEQICCARARFDHGGRRSAPRPRQPPRRLQGARAQRSRLGEADPFNRLHRGQGALRRRRPCRRRSLPTVALSVTSILPPKLSQQSPLPPDAVGEHAAAMPGRCRGGSTRHRRY